MAVSAGNRQCTIVLHDGRVSHQNVLVGSKLLPPACVAIVQGAGSKPLVIKAPVHTGTSDEVSLHITLGARFNFENRMPAIIKLVDDPQTVTATHIEFSFKDHYLSRADIWRFMRELDGSVVFQGQVVKHLGSSVATVEAIYILGKAVESALLSQVHTRPIFRSQSARFTILIQISKEMIDFWLDGSLMYERLISGYLTELFSWWQTMKARHQVSIVLFGRIEGDRTADEPYGSRDFYHVIDTDVSSAQGNELLRNLRRAFNDAHLPRQVTLAADGNMVEAFHLAVMDFMEESLDIRLNSTGSSVIAITAGCGFFNASYEMLKRTTHLLMGNSIGVDLVSLSQKPFHPVPLFRYTQEEQWRYALPHWIDISFWTEQGQKLQSGWPGVSIEGDVKKVTIDPLPVLDMDAYDLETFSGIRVQTVKTNEIPLEHKPAASPPKVNAQPQGAKRKSALYDGLHARPISAGSDSRSSSSVVTNEEIQDSSRNQDVSKKAGTKSQARAKKEGISHPLLKTNRTISLGQKGLIPVRGSASTTVSTEHAGQGKDVTAGSTVLRGESSTGLVNHIRRSLHKKTSQQSLTSDVSHGSIRPSRPIDIQHNQGGRTSEPDHMSALGEGRPADETLTATVKPDVQFNHMGTIESISSMQQQLAPWVTLLNPSNPRRDNMQIAAQYRKWQHVFTRTVTAQSFKWTSMCSPALLPLTTDYCPSPAELDKDYRISRRHIVPLKQMDGVNADSEDLLRDLISLRLNRGFQIVVDKADVALAHGDKSIDRALLSKSNRYHELHRLPSQGVDVIEYDLKAEVATERAAELTPALYYPLMKGSLALKPRRIEVSMVHSAKRIDWTRIDQQFVDDTLGAEVMRIARMRFVFIPLEPTRSEMVGTTKSRELTEDEKRIEGIQRLTQQWQRHRHFTAEDKSHQASFVRPRANRMTIERDPNPLSIEYSTRDPSIVVHTHGPKLAGQAAYDEATAVLIGEAEVYHTSNFDVSKLVKHLQNEPPSGIEVRDRRWFATTHFNCFRGDELINWLLRVFKDLTTREDAVEIGNELMKRGIFTHVRHKHQFRDGNYFYQIASNHRTTEYSDNAGFFSKRSSRSIPPTPSSETRRSPSVRATRRDSDVSSRATPSSAPTEKKQLMLSETMQYNVDERKESNHVELINLHYDRIHNAENCYHIQLDWMAATERLVYEATKRWASLAEGHGLRMIQVPLLEASKLGEEHAFDQPFRVRLAKAPPSKILATPILDPVHSPRGRIVVEDHFAYHKAILRKMDFVLDSEAASLFDGPLDVRYSWGRPKYTMTQFVHRSGTLLAQVAANEQTDFLLVVNRLAIGKPFGTLKQSDPTPIGSILKEFTRFCHSSKALSSFYDEIGRSRMVSMSPNPYLPLSSDQDVPPMQLPPHVMQRIQTGT